jgi:fatty-acid desaturase
LFGSPYLFAVARKQLPADPPPPRWIVPLRIAVPAFYVVVLGLDQMLIMAAVHLVCYLGIMGMVNAVGHLYGRKPHPDVPGYDIAWLAIPLLGHGYHNSHHAHPAAPRTGALDPIWPLLRALSSVGLVDLEDRRGRTAVRSCCRASEPLVPTA